MESVRLFEGGTGINKVDPEEARAGNAAGLDGDLCCKDSGGSVAVRAVAPSDQ